MPPISDPFIVYNFAVDSEYDKFQAAIDEGNEVGKQALIDLPGQTFTEDAADDTDWTYNATLLGFAASKVDTLNQIPANAVLGHRFETKDANWGDIPSRVGTLNGVAAIVGQKLACPDGSGYVELIGINWLNPSEFWAKVKFTPNYGDGTAAGDPSQDVTLMQFFEPGTNNNGFQLVHDSQQALRISAWTKVGVASMVGVGYGSHFFTAGVPEEVLVYCNFKPGSESQKVWVGGALKGAETNIASDRTNDKTKNLAFRLGGTTYCDATFDDLVVYTDAAPAAGDITTGYTVPFAPYLETVATMPLFNYSLIGTIRALTNFVAVTTGAPRFIIEGQWFNPAGGGGGGAWEASLDTYATASDAATVLANIGALDVADETLIEVKLAFPDSQTASSFDNLIVTYTAQHYGTFGRLTPTAPIIAKTIQAIQVLIAAQPAGTSLGMVWSVNGQLKFFDVGVTDTWRGGLPFSLCSS
jgi:hypothetical protein